MANKSHVGAATRRSFITVAGAVLSAPVAAAAVTSSRWLPPSGGSGDTLAARLAKLEDLNAIRALNQALFSDPSSAQLEPDVRAISPVDFGQHDVIEVAADRQTATARVHVMLHTEIAIGPECTLVEMARLQGGGTIACAEPGVLENAYVRRDGVWKLLRSTRRQT
jgi:hypothetical protein